MNNKPTYPRQLSRRLVIGFLLSVAFFMAACDIGFNLSKPKLDETDIARAVEETLIAEEGNETGAAPVVTEAPSASPTSPAPTDTLVPIESPVEAPTQPPASPIPTAAELTEQVYSTFGALYWVPLSSGCKDMTTKCYKLNDDYRTLSGQAEAILTTDQDILVEESWPSPHLVYWNKRNLKFQATMNLFVDGTPITVKYIPKGEVGQWKEDFFDLSEYKGKTIRVQFICPVGMKYVSSWILNDLRIVPDYNPK